MLQQVREWLTGYTTYTGYLYLMLVLTITMAAFTLLVAGLSFGAALSPLLIGIPIIAMTLVLARWITNSDVLATKRLLGAYIASLNKRNKHVVGLMDATKNKLSNTTNWRSLLYCFVKVPLNVFTSIVMVIATIIPLVIIGMSFYYNNPNTPAELLGMPISTMPRAMVTAMLGITLLTVTIMIVRATVWLWREFTKYVLITDNNTNAFAIYSS